MSPRLKKLPSDTLQTKMTEYDAAIKLGRATEVRADLHKLIQTKLPRATLTTLASLARRAEAPDLGLKILSSIVRSTKPINPPAQAHEIAEYAANLVKIGATTEALSLLKGVDTKLCPQALLYTAFAHIAVWDYRASVASLEALVNHPKADGYLRFLGHVNLASSLTFEKRHEEALTLIDTLLTEAKLKEYTLLSGNLLQLRAQNAVHLKRWKEAEAALEQAQLSLATTGGRFGLFVKKWEVFLSLLKSGTDSKSFSQLENIKKEALKVGHWETLRDCDRMWAFVSHDQALAHHLYFGTPYESFRGKLRLDWGDEHFLLPDSYDWKLGGHDNKALVLDLSRGAFGGAKEPLRPDGIVHKLLRILSSDFYRPQRLACLFAALYPEEFYFAGSADLRLHQAANRLRAWFKANHFPLEIEESEGFYRLVARAPVIIRVPRPEKRLGNSYLDILKNRWPQGQTFSVRQAAEALGLSTSSAFRLFKKSLESGELARVGSGNDIRYYFTDKASLKTQAA